MAKRKHDCSLDGIVIEYYRRSKCKKTLKSLEKQNRNNCSKSMYDDFVSYLRKSKAKTENYNDDLGFELLKDKTKLMFIKCNINIYYKILMNILDAKYLLSLKTPLELQSKLLRVFIFRCQNVSRNQNWRTFSLDI